MQQVTSEISRKEQAFFDLICCINELQSLSPELSTLEFEQIDQEFKKLRSTFQEKQSKTN